MKCFTELRDNQKIRPHHTKYFGEYGISMKDEWVEKSKATPVIYVSENDEISKRMGLIISFLKSFLAGSISIQSAIIDLISFTEIGEHRGEYEWRIVNNNLIEGNQFERLTFTNSDIEEIFVPYKHELMEFNSYFKNNEKPKISLTKEIVLTDEEVKLFNRK